MYGCKLAVICKKTSLGLLFEQISYVENLFSECTIFFYTDSRVCVFGTSM